jgi:hypothetical protein
MEETNLYAITVPPMAKTLRSLFAILDKVAEHAHKHATERRPAGYFESALLNDHLIFDQFSLLQQIQRVSDNAKGGTARLAGLEAPAMEDTEKTVEELKARIEKTIAFIESVDKSSIIGQEARQVVLPYWQGKHLSAFDYATQYLMPNFYFHAVTAYDIVRKNGVPIGKTDYIGTLPLRD